MKLRVSGDFSNNKFPDTEFFDNYNFPTVKFSDRQIIRKVDMYILNINTCYVLYQDSLQIKYADLYL